MGDFFDAIKNLFTPQSSGNNPVVQELITRTEQELAAFDAWVNSTTHIDLTLHLKQQYQAYRQGQLDADTMSLQSASSNGFVFKYVPEIANSKDYQYLFDFLKSRVLELNYSSYVSDVKTYYRAKKVEKLERHYLKPKVRRPIEKSGKANQLFGNITIEHLIRQDQPIHVRLIAQQYVDHNFTRGMPFEDLMDHLFN